MGKRVFICVGHGGSDAGAVGHVVEKRVTLEISLAAKAELKRNGVVVGISRIRDEEDGLSKEVNMANAFGADVVIAVHANAGGGDGFEAYVQTNRYAGRSRSIARNIESRVVAMGQNSRGIKTKLGSHGDYYYWLRNVKAPTVLLEGFFVDTSDAYDFDTKAEQAALGKAYAHGILDYLGIRIDPLPFRDVAVNDYYHDAVQWALDKGITNGTSKDAFSPDEFCTRAQAVTMLYRMYGGGADAKPHGFDDVDATDYYDKAVRWAKEKGITNGVSDGSFAPDDVCTRGQVVTMLYRAAGSPAVVGKMPFEDVKADAYYAPAVQWAVSKGITRGTDATHFAPNKPCTRADMVTFLHRSHR